MHDTNYPPPPVAAANVPIHAPMPVPAAPFVSSLLGAYAVPDETETERNIQNTHT